MCATDPRPRGMQAMILGGKILALLDERYNVAFDDIRQAALPALRHRLILNFEAQADGLTTDQVIQNLVQSVPDTPRIERTPDQASMSTNLFDEAFLRKLERLALLSRRAAAGQLQGERRSARRGQSVEFADYRPYVLGDDFRRIDWNAYARLERFFIKLFVEERELTLHLLVDNSLSMDWGEPNKLAYAVRAAGSPGLYRPARPGPHRPDSRWRTGSTQPSDTNRARQKSSPQLFQMLLDLQAASPNGNTSRPVAYQLGAYAANAVAPGPLALFTDLMDDGWRTGIHALAGRGFEITLVHLLSPDELEPTAFR